VLLAVVIGVWGLIGFKFLNAVDNSPKELAMAAPDEIFVPKQMKEREIFTIAADYRDPFLGTVYAPKKKKKTGIAKKTKKKVPEKSIQYTGFITDKSSKQKIFFVTIEGQQQMMSVNDTFQEVKLVRGNKNSIKVKYNGRTQTITIAQ
jgi:hypothetical protein